MKKLSLILCAAMALVFTVPAATTSAFANSAPPWEYGVDVQGLVVTHENSVLEVEHENLTFNIKNFPTAGHGSPTDDNYKSTVTAEYHFYNPSVETVHTQMAFASGELPQYYDDISSLSAFVTVNGEEVPVEKRHTYGRYNGNFLDEALDQIRPDWYSDGFFSPDLPVTEYTVTVPKGEKRKTCEVYFSCDTAKNRLLADDAYLSGIDFEFYSEECEDKFYVLGDISSFEVTGAYYKYIDNNNNTCIGDPSAVSVEKTATLTFKELLLKKYEQGCGVSEMDWYNAVAARLNSKYLDVGDIRDLSLDRLEFFEWYVYEVELAPLGKMVNAVTVPIFPDIQINYNPLVYSYTYYLSPAKGWSDFGSLDIEIVTDYKLYYNNGSWEKTDKGFKTSYGSLPEGELSFRLSTVEEWHITTKEEPFIVAVAIFMIFGILCSVAPLIAGIVIVIVYVVKQSKKKKQKKDGQNKNE